MVVGAGWEDWSTLRKNKQPKQIDINYVSTLDMDQGNTSCIHWIDKIKGLL